VTSHRTELQGAPSCLPEFLERSPWYRKLPPDLRALTLETAIEKTFGPGDYIARVGQPSLHWYGLMRGFLQMYVVSADGDETTLYCLREGEWGGEGSLLKREMRKYDLRALTPAHLCMIPTETFETLRNNVIEFNHFLCQIMNERMGVFVGMLEASRLMGPEMRVARSLMMLANAGGDTVQELSILQHELALISGLSRQRANVAIHELKRRGLLLNESSRGNLVINLPLLREYVIVGH
jgi:CRP/FNR family transcriptional regulator, cyclic AMP receptor protein